MAGWVRVNTAENTKNTDMAHKRGKKVIPSPSLIELLEVRGLRSPEISRWVVSHQPMDFAVISL
eukprot:scaffold22726_cov177-Cylindrotheca_fusiformis.AAC.2